ncbi:MAG: hypothetical protein E7557_00025 [Ruminococcaceae bacterium]|nr:hypothetical protein [Oscillospiraceae bacterium]
MKTNNKQGFIFSVSAYLVVTFLDLYFTFIATPDLELEGNPLYNVLFFGWTGLITINVISYLFYCLIAYYAFIGYKRPITNETDLRKYLAFISYGDADKYSAMMWKFPKYWAPQIACLCWSVAVILPFARLLIVIVWFLLILDIDATLFFNIVASIPMGRIDFVVAILGAWILSFIWIQKEFKLNLKNIEKRKKEEGKLSD